MFHWRLSTIILAAALVETKAVDVNCTEFTWLVYRACKTQPTTIINETHVLNFIHPNETSPNDIDKIAFSDNLSFIPQQLFHTFPQLTALNLKHNQIECVPSRAFLSASNLDELSLEYNKIHIIEDNAFDGLSKLRDLFLNNNRFSKIERLALANLPELRILCLEQNQIEHIEEGALNFPKLQKLYLRRNKLKSLPDSVFAQTSTLQFLSLENNGLEQINNAVYHLHRLEHLRLGDNKIVDFDLKKFAGMTNLEKLFINNNTFDFDMVIVPANDATAAAPKSKLELIDLSYNQIKSGVIFSKLKLFPNLTHVYLHSSGLRRIDLDTVRTGGLTKLREIEAGENDLDKDWLEETLPKLSMKSDKWMTYFKIHVSC